MFFGLVVLVGVDGVFGEDFAGVAVDDHGVGAARDAMAAFMYRFAGKPATTPPSKSPFTDLPKTSQFYKEVTWLADSGISRGWTMGGGKYEYRPYDEITREAMAAFMYRYSKL